MNHVTETIEGSVAVACAAAAHLWGELYPVMAGLTTICGFVLTVHGVYHLIRSKFRKSISIPTYISEE